MQEPHRLNLYKVVQKGLAVANRNTFMHRLIYIANYDTNQRVAWQQLVEGSIKAANDDKWEQPVAGICLFYQSYIINILEGSERLINKHLNIFSEMLADKGISFLKFKILLIVYHINKRYFIGWSGTQVTPPLLLTKIHESHNPKQHGEMLLTCVLKLYRVIEYLNSYMSTDYRKAATNLSQSCKKHIPETELLDFLLSSPLLLSVDQYLQNQKTLPQDLVSQDLVWPAPPDFVPYNILHENEGLLNYDKKSESCDRGDRGSENADEESRTTNSSRSQSTSKAKKTSLASVY